MPNSALLPAPRSRPSGRMGQLAPPSASGPRKAKAISHALPFPLPLAPELEAPEDTVHLHSPLPLPCFSAPESRYKTLRCLHRHPGHNLPGPSWPLASAQSLTLPGCSMSVILCLCSPHPTLTSSTARARPGPTVPAVLSHNAGLQPR